MKKILLLVSVAACCLQLDAQNFEMSWRKGFMDGSRTGVTIPGTDNIPQAMGRVEDGVYYAPNGKVYKKGSVVKVASLMLEAQPAMAFVKEKIGCCPEEMRKNYPESALTDMIVDCMMKMVQKTTGRTVDVGFLNFGGIRQSFSKGDVLMDDVVSMLPFENYICYVVLQGSDLRKVYESMAAAPEIVGGVELVYRNHKLESVMIGGEPLDDGKLYGVATIDFLLEGGDKLTLAKNAKDLVETNVLLRDSLLPYLRELAAAGKPIVYQTDGRVRYED